MDTVGPCAARDRRRACVREEQEGENQNNSNSPTATVPAATAATRTADGRIGEFTTNGYDSCFLVHGCVRWGGVAFRLGRTSSSERELRRWTDARQRGCGVTCDSIERPANLLRHGGREDHRFAMLIIFHEKTDTTIDPFCSPIHFQSSALVSAIVPPHQETVSEDCVFCTWLTKLASKNNQFNFSYLVVSVHQPCQSCASLFLCVNVCHWIFVNAIVQFFCVFRCVLSGEVCVLVCLCVSVHVCVESECFGVVV